MAKRSVAKPVATTPVVPAAKVTDETEVVQGDTVADPVSEDAYVVGVVDAQVGEQIKSWTPTATETPSPVTSTVPTDTPAMNLIVVTQKNGWQVVVDQDTNMVMLKEEQGFNLLSIGIIEQPLHTLTEQAIKVVALSMWMNFYKNLP